MIDRYHYAAPNSYYIVTRVAKHRPNLDSLGQIFESPQERVELEDLIR